MLTGKYRPDATPESGTRLGHPAYGAVFGGKTREERTWEILSVVRDIAARRGITPAQVALAWTAARPGVSSVLLGARTLEQLKGNLAAVEVTLTEDETRQLDLISEPRIDYPYGPMAQALRSRPLAEVPLTMPIAKK
ncbi:aldo/keto reductase [Amycolatopsis sp. EV170708-02-1]|nr:aldo/keto reductase [Amycolatopsis sp. EV170708-02-1]UMP07035.1 aldo/keto reductase [Amycolatopsis sp. EV170708-02-1]